MSKIIIQNNSEADWDLCLKLVSDVIALGRISKNNTQYCYATRIYRINNVKLKHSYMVYAAKNKRSDRFLIFNDA
jgi:hypothetical protein